MEIGSVQNEPASKETAIDANCVEEARGVSESHLQSQALPQSATKVTSTVNLSAANLVRAALKPGSNVDFPQITEICNRLEVEPREARAAVGVLVTALCDKCAPLRMKYQALTIVNEMLYNTHVVSVLRSAEKLPGVLATLRSARDTELGPVTDENIRMLATEVNRVCFSDSFTKQKQQENSWTLGSSMNSNLGKWDKARQEAKKQLEVARQRASKTLEKTATSASSAMQKAERAIERTANIVMQEAEVMFEGLVDAPQPEHNSQRPFYPPPRTSQRMPSAAESVARQQGPAVVSNKPSIGGVGEDKLSRQLHNSMDEVVQRLHAAEARAAEAEHALAVRIAEESAAAADDDRLIQQLEDSSNLVFGFTTRLAEVDGEREQMIRRTAQLETDILAVQAVSMGNSETLTEAQKLRARIRALEAALAAGSAYIACSTEELSEALGDCSTNDGRTVPEKCDTSTHLAQHASTAEIVLDKHNDAPAKMATASAVEGALGAATLDTPASELDAVTASDAEKLEAINT